MIERLKTILNYYNLSASAFADKIDIPRSSISHLLSGRNKPSLDFVLKLVANFKEVDLQWFLYGTGSFPKKEEVIVKTTSTSSALSLFTEDKSNEIEEIKEKKEIPKEIITKKEVKQSKSIEKIVVFYSDGTFKDYDKSS